MIDFEGIRFFAYFWLMVVWWISLRGKMSWLELLRMEKK